jgi:hypothetical protein
MPQFYRAIGADPSAVSQPDTDPKQNESPHFRYLVTNPFCGVANLDTRLDSRGAVNAATAASVKKRPPTAAMYR